ncbi:MAG TPA: glycosyltransferase 87 family protein, partial [Vicinamibacteria bacterium]|nr:glycosyltransferase 87 family protein [Vicinamibacteria bacterium]
PIALALAAAAVFFAIVYLALALIGARPRLRLAALALAAVVLVAIPTAALVAMGAATGRPYGQDGGVVQLPLAIDRILAGQSPYGADYSDSMLGRQARVSDFWAEHGGNPILHHHAYLPGTHFLMMPFVPLSRAAIGVFDPRVVTLLAFVAAGILAYRLGSSPGLALSAAAAVWVSPLVYWQQIFGANDIVVAALLLGAVHCARASRAGAAAALLGLACATKQLAWPFAPFLLAHLSGARTLGDLVSAPARGRLLRALAITAAVFLVVVAPVAALDFRAFWGDVVRYNAGLSGGDNYPLGGTPGLGFANFLVYFGTVSSLRDHVSLGGLYLLLIPIGVWLLREQLRRGTAADALVTGSAALLLSLYVSRVVHPNYFILAAVLLPAAVAAGAVLAVDALIGGLALLATGIEIAEGEVFATTWADAVTARWPPAGGLWHALAPRAGPALTHDPLGLVFSAIACGLGIVFLVGGVLRMPHRARAAVLVAAVVVLAVVPASIVMTVGRLSGTPRVQRAWAASTWSYEAVKGPMPRQAWSESFRKDPPGSAAVPSNPGAYLLADLVRAVGIRDLRAVAVIALGAAVFFLWRLSPTAAGLERVSLLMLPPAIVGVTFGSGDVCLLALLAAALFAVARGGARSGSATIGATAALFPRLVPPASLLARATGPAVAAFAAVVLVVKVVGGTLEGPLALGPGLGLSNLRLYFGAEPGEQDVLSLVLMLALTAASWLVVRRLTLDAASSLAAAATLLLATLWLAPNASPDDVLVPIALLVIAVTHDRDEGFDTAEGAP